MSPRQTVESVAPQCLPRLCVMQAAEVTAIVALVSSPFPDTGVFYDLIKRN